MHRGADRGRPCACWKTSSHRPGLEGLPWRERVRGGLVVILGFFDREPALARVCVVQALSSGPRVLERREGILARLAEVLDEGRGEGQRGGDRTALTAEGLVGAAFGIVHARLLRGEREALLGLVGELMGMIVLPYMGPAAARREQAMPAPKAPAPGRAGRWHGRCLLRIRCRGCRCAGPIAPHA